MAQLVVRNIENEVKIRLQRHAKRHGQSMEAEIRDILRNAARDDDASFGGLGTEISLLFRKVGLKSDIAELRGIWSSRLRSIDDHSRYECALGVNARNSGGEGSGMA